MAIYEHVTEFAGLPVVVLPDSDQGENRLWLARNRAEFGEGPAPDRAALDAAYRAALADPGAVAWRLQVLPYTGGVAFEELFAHFLDEVDTTRVTALIVGCWGESYEAPGSGPRDLLVSHADRFPALRALFFGEILQEEAEISWIQQTDVAPLLAAFPRLEELWVRGGDGLEFPATRHTALRTLVVQTGGLPREVTTGILASDLPALEHLELWFGIDWYGGTTEVGDLAPLLAGRIFPGLRRLGLRNSPWGDDLVRALADAPVLNRVEALDLSGHVLTDKGGEVLATAPAFRALNSLVMRHHFVFDPVLDRVRKALADVELDMSEPGEPDDYDVDDDGNKTPVYYPETTE